MSERDNVKVVQDAYAAFGRGDLPGILERLAEDVDWEFKGPSTVPWAGHWRGRANVRDFFVKLAGAVEAQEFEPKQYVAQGDDVIAIGRYAATAKSTGKPFEVEWAMAW